MKKNLRIYFEGPQAREKEQENKYRAIIKSIKKNNCHISCFLFNTNKKNKMPSSNIPELYKKTLTEMNKSDAFVAEMTFGNPILAVEIHQAVHEFKKPALILTHESANIRPEVYFLKQTSKLLKIKKYSFENLDQIIKNFADCVKGKIPCIRFTLRLDEETDDYLEYMKLKIKESSKNQVILKLLREQKNADLGYDQFRIKT